MAELQDTGSAETRVWWRRLHGALMPDYNRQTMAYWWITVLTGGAVLAHALRELSALSLLDLAEVGVATAIAVLAGCFPFPGSAV